MLQRQKTFTAVIISIVSLFITVIFWTNIINVYIEKNERFGYLNQTNKSILNYDHNAALNAESGAYINDILSEGYENMQALELDKWSIEHAFTIYIPSIKVSAPVLMPSLKYWVQHEWDLLEEQMQIGLLYGVVAYPNSSVPGKKGTLIIAGHSSPPDERAAESDFSSIFEKLPLVTYGDEIIITEGDNKYYYEVETSRIVSASNTSVLQQQRESDMITLITCYPIGTTRDRLVITAKIVDKKL